MHLASLSSFGFMDSVLFRLVLWRPGQEPSDVVLTGVAFALSAQLSSTPTTTSAREGAALLQTLAKRSLGALDFSFFVRYFLDVLVMCSVWVGGFTKFDQSYIIVPSGAPNPHQWDWLFFSERLWKTSPGPNQRTCGSSGPDPCVSAATQVKGVSPRSLLHRQCTDT